MNFDKDNMMKYSSIFLSLCIVVIVGATLIGQKSSDNTDIKKPLDEETKTLDVKSDDSKTEDYAMVEEICGIDRNFIIKQHPYLDPNNTDDYNREKADEIQKYLKFLGFYDGTIDGEFGKGGKRAIKNFQKEKCSKGIPKKISKENMIQIVEGEPVKEKTPAEIQAEAILMLQDELNSLNNQIKNLEIDLDKQIAVTQETETEKNALKEEYAETRKSAKERAGEDEFRLYEIEGNDSSYALWALLFLSIATLASVFYSTRLYRWRTLKSQNEGKDILLPEEFHNLMESFQKDINTHSSSVKNFDNMLDQYGQENREKISGMMKAFLDMQKQLDSKDKELKRYKEGYDNQIYSKFLSRFINIYEIVLSDDSEESSRITERLKMRFEDAFEECNIEIFGEEHIGKKLEKGISIEGIETTLKAPSRKEDALKIFELSQEGYRLKVGENKYQVLLPAKVMVYGEFE